VENLKKTPLINTYEKYGGKIVDFAGWALPVEFEGIIKEHEAVRNKAGLFDVSHMGEIIIKGKDAYGFVEYLITNSIASLEDNQVLYTFMCNRNGGVVDDLLVYRFSKDEYFLVVNASNLDKDYKWIVDNVGDFDADVCNISDNTAQLAIQGPKAQYILQKLVDVDLAQIKFFHFLRDVNIDGKKAIVSRTGYTGEDGFEIYVSPKDVVSLWDRILEVGHDEEIVPVGLGARDTLRFEANLPLYGNELSEDITPLEAGFGFFVKLDKVDFIGREALKNQKENGLNRKIVAFEMKDRGIPRHGYEVYSDDQKIGTITTGYFSPTLKKNIGLAIIDADHAKIGNEIIIAIRKKRLKAEIIKRQFYTKKTQK